MKARLLEPPTLMIMVTRLIRAPQPHDYGNQAYGYGNHPHDYGNQAYGYGNHPHDYGNQAYGYGNHPHDYGNQAYGFAGLTTENMYIYYII